MFAPSLWVCVGYAFLGLWFCVKCNTGVQRYMSTSAQYELMCAAGFVLLSHHLTVSPPLLSQNHIHLHIFFCHPCYHLRFPILIVHHPNDGGLKTLMVGNQLLAGRPDPDQQCLSADDSKTPPLQIDCTLDSTYEETVSQYVTYWKYRVGSGYEFSVAQLSTWLWRSSLMWWWQRWR